MQVLVDAADVLASLVNWFSLWDWRFESAGVDVRSWNSSLFLLIPKNILELIQRIGIFHL